MERIVYKGIKILFRLLGLIPQKWQRLSADFLGRIVFGIVPYVDSQQQLGCWGLLEVVSLSPALVVVVLRVLLKSRLVYGVILLFFQ